MALRVKNVAAGYVDASGFHPIRSSSDYDPKKLKDEKRKKSETARKKKIGGWKVSGNAKYQGYTNAPAKKKAAPKKRATKKTATKKSVAKKANPLPVGKWKSAKVMRTKSGDVKVMIKY